MKRIIFGVVFILLALFLVYLIQPGHSIGQSPHNQIQMTDESSDCVTPIPCTTPPPSP